MSEFTYYSDSEIGPEILDECARVAPLVTALFDGEADTEATRLARRHLVECVRCADTWQAWDRTRYLMHTLPVPAVPAGLLVRVLMACRLSALPRRRKRPVEAAQTESLRLHDVQVRDAQREAEMAAGAILPSFTTAAPLPYDLPEVPVPPHLKEAILRRTVGLSQAEARVEMLVSEPQPRRNLHWDIAGMVRRTSFAVPRISRYGTALAVPAVVAWLMFLVPAPNLTRTADTTTVAVPVPAVPVTGTTAPVRAVAQHSIGRAPQHLVGPNAAKPAVPAVAVTANAPKSTADGSLNLAEAVAKPAKAVTDVQLTALTLPPSTAPQRAINQPAQPLTLAALPASTAPVAHPALAVARHGLVRTDMPAMPRLHARMAAPQPQLTPFPNATTVSLSFASSSGVVSDHAAVVRDAEPKMRVAPLDPDDFVTTAPAEDAETLRKMREVVDNYRATLVADASDDDASDDSTDS